MANSIRLAAVVINRGQPDIDNQTYRKYRW